MGTSFVAHADWHALLAVLAVAVVGCSQVTGGPTDGDGQATTSASTASSSAGASVADTAQEEAAVPQPPVEFTGRVDCGPPVRSDSEDTLDVGDEGMVLNRYRGGAWQQSVMMTDPRLEGTVYHTFEADTYAMPDGESSPEVWAATRRIENEAGSWVFRGYGGSYADGTSIGNAALVYIGEGAYEGLIAIMDESLPEGACSAEVRGLIFHGAPVPEPYVQP